ncbi:hypothetical protein B0H19DRAFT_1081573 [Mycena capillaripes]|nr:hypothetical protein B0H19DRAFT_1081573 [Mycena capillaripes]
MRARRSRLGTGSSSPVPVRGRLLVDESGSLSTGIVEDLTILARRGGEEVEGLAVKEEHGSPAGPSGVVPYPYPSTPYPSGVRVYTVPLKPAVFAVPRYSDPRLSHDATERMEDGLEHTDACKEGVSPRGVMGRKPSSMILKKFLVAGQTAWKKIDSKFLISRPPPNEVQKNRNLTKSDGVHQKAPLATIQERIGAKWVLHSLNSDWPRFSSDTRRTRGPGHGIDGFLKWRTVPVPARPYPSYPSTDPRPVLFLTG